MVECQYIGVWTKEVETEFFWLSRVALFVGGFGLVGNALTLVVLIRSHLRKKPFFKLLRTLALYDLLFIVSSTSFLYFSSHWHSTFQHSLKKANLSCQMMCSLMSQNQISGIISRILTTIRHDICQKIYTTIFWKKYFYTGKLFE